MIFKSSDADNGRSIQPAMVRAMTSVAFAALCFPAAAFAQDTAPQADAEAAVEGDAIIVTARRGEENLQDVPVSVQVVTGDKLEKLAITSVEEVSKLAPGLTLSNPGGGAANTVVTLRGVTWQPGSGTPATPIYFNEVPFDPGQTIVSLFDVGQIEVLRGPQGTSRGAPSISGAVTISTRKPDLDEFGGYVFGLYGEGDHADVQAAVNVPIIKDVLAIRLAANIEESNGNRVESVNSAIRAKFKDRSYRATVLLQPTDTLSLQAMYQRRKSDTLNFTQVAGPGSPGAAARLGGLFAAIPANFNGPALTVSDRASVQDLPSIFRPHVDLLTVNASWEVLGHRLSYNFGRQFNRSGTEFRSQDPLNILPGFEPYQTVDNLGLPKFSTHEVRVSSLPDPDRPFEYDIGWFSKHSGGKGLLVGVPVFALPGTLGGAFGSPPTPPANRLPDPRYVLNSSTNIQIAQVFDSFYGNVRFHIDDRTELSGGLAIVRDRVPVSLAINTSSALAIVTPVAALRGATCPQAGLLNSNYPGFCDFSIAAGPRPGQVNNDKYTDALYNFSVSHKFTDDVLVYATTGSSFRTGLPAINNPGLPANLVTPKPETAKSYEIGVKSSFGRTLRVNAAVFQLDYKDQLTTAEGVTYFNTVNGATAATSLAFYSNVDTRVRGAELEIAASPIDNLSLGANLSYSKIKSQGGSLPCNDATRPINAANPINFCASPKGQVLNTQAPFQATFNGSYEVPITESFGGYFRFNVNYQGNNPNFGNFKTGPTVFKRTPSYALVDLFAGVSGGDGAWNLGVYAKNVFDKNAELGRIKTNNTIYPLYATTGGYDVVRTTQPREVGVTLRYAFGSR